MARHDLPTSRIGFRATVVAASICVLAAGACGGKSAEGATSPTGPPLSKPAYIAAANAVCATADAKIKALPMPSSASSSETKAAYLGKVGALLEGELDGLRAIKPPTADKATIDSLDALFVTALAQIGRARTAALGGVSTEYEAAMNAVSSTSSEFNQIATSYGLDICGRTS